MYPREQVVLINEADDFERYTQQEHNLPIWVVDIWPFVSAPQSVNKQDLLAHALNHLPSKERLSSLCEAFLENIGWLYRIVGRSQIMEELVPGIYKRLDKPEDQLTIDPHDLALLLIVCAYGAVADQTQDKEDGESLRYYGGSRVALSLKSAFDSANLATIQTLYMMGQYISTVGPTRSLESAWLTINFAMSLAISVSSPIHIKYHTADVPSPDGPPYVVTLARLAVL